MPDGVLALHFQASKAKAKAKVEGSKDDLFGADPKKKRKMTEDGYPIYTEEVRQQGGRACVASCGSGSSVAMRIACP